MTGLNESAAYLGGIGTMLSQAEVCPRCGKVHRARYSPFQRADVGVCPDTVVGLFPTLTAEDPEGSSRGRDRAELTVREVGSPSPSGIVPPRTGATARNGRLVVPWPMPTDAEGYL